MQDSQRTLLGIALLLCLHWMAYPLRAQESVLDQYGSEAWINGVRDQLATRESLENLYQRTYQHELQISNYLARSQAVPAASLAPYVQARERDESILRRTRARLAPIYRSLQDEYQKLNYVPDPKTRQELGGMIAAGGQIVPPIWNRMMALPTPPAGVEGAVEAAAEAAVPQSHTEGASEAAAEGAAHSTVRTRTTAAAGTQGAAATNGTSGLPRNTIFRMEPDSASGMMVLRPFDPKTNAAIEHVQPVRTQIPALAETEAVPTSLMSRRGAGTTVADLQKANWVMEPDRTSGNMVLRARDPQTNQHVRGLRPIGTEVKTPNSVSQPHVEEAAVPTSGAVRTAIAPENVTQARWTLEPDKNVGTMVLRARDPVTNLHLKGYRSVPTDIPVGETAAAGVKTPKGTVFQAEHSPTTGEYVFKPRDAAGNTVHEAPTIRANADSVQSTRAAASGQASSRSSGTYAGRGGVRASETTVPGARAEEPITATEQPAGGTTSKLKEFGMGAVKWAGLSAGITLASNVVQQVVKGQDPAHINWRQATSFLTDKRYWGGTAGGFVGGLAGSAIASALPGGIFVKSLLSIGGASLGWQFGSGNLKNTDWLGLGLTTAGAAAGTALGMAVGGPVGAFVGGLGGQLLTQWIYDNLKGGPESIGKGAADVLPPTASLQQSEPMGYYPQSEPPAAILLPHQEAYLPPMPYPVPEQYVDQGQYPPNEGGYVLPPHPPGTGQYPAELGKMTGQFPTGAPNVGQMAPPGSGGAQDNPAELNEMINHAYNAFIASQQAGDMEGALAHQREYQALQLRLRHLRQEAYR